MRGTLRIILATKPHLPVLGGAQLTIHYLAEELVRRGHAVTVLAQPPRHPPRRARGPVPYEVIDASAPAARLSELLEAGPADCVVINGYHDRTAPWAREMLRAAGSVPRIFYLHDIGTVQLAAEERSRIDHVVTVSRFLAERARELGVESVCIEPIVDRHHYATDTSREVALFVNPVGQKGAELAFALAELRPDIPFAFVLCWPLEESAVAAIEARATSLPNVQIRESVTEPRLLYGDARVLLVPSPYPEAWPRVAAEAQASGIPVIGSSTGGVSEAADDAGLFLDPDAPVRRWEQALESLWEDEILYRSHVVRARRAAARDSITPGSAGDRFESLIRALGDGEGDAPAVERAAL